MPFLQYGFNAVRHERSFACTRGEAQPAETPLPDMRERAAPVAAKGGRRAASYPRDRQKDACAVRARGRE